MLQASFVLAGVVSLIASLATAASADPAPWLPLALELFGAGALVAAAMVPSFVVRRAAGGAVRAGQVDFHRGVESDVPSVRSRLVDRAPGILLGIAAALFALGVLPWALDDGRHLDAFLHESGYAFWIVGGAFALLAAVRWLTQRKLPLRVRGKHRPEQRVTGS